MNAKGNGPMAQPIRVRNARGELVEPRAVSASEAKNVGRILDYVARDGGVTITRRNEPFAVIIPIETYARLAAAEHASLDTLSAEFDALFEKMQEPGMAGAMERAFRMSPDELGRAAAEQARGSPPAARKAKAARLVRARRPRG